MWCPWSSLRPAMRLAIAAGHCFVIFLRDRFPVNILVAVTTLAPRGAMERVAVVGDWQRVRTAAEIFFSLVLAGLLRGRRPREEILGAHLADRPRHNGRQERCPWSIKFSHNSRALPAVRQIERASMAFGQSIYRKTNNLVVSGRL